MAQWPAAAEFLRGAAREQSRNITEPPALGVEAVTEAQFKSWREGHPWKLNLARKLRVETTVTIGWLAERLHMGTRGHLAHLLWKTKRDAVSQPQPILGI